MAGRGVVPGVGQQPGIPARPSRPATRTRGRGPATPPRRHEQRVVAVHRRAENGGIRMTTDTQPRWRGINHLAMVTPDMDATVRFYHGVLGMRLVTTLKAGPMRHYFFEIAPENTIAFFEVKDAKPFQVAAGIPDARKAQFDHLS